MDIANVPRHRGPGKDGAALQERTRRTVKVALVGEVPLEAMKDPVGWAEKHLENQAPEAAKEVEFALKFGDNKMRYEAARDVLAMKGITTKPKDTGVIPQAMVFNFNGPTTPQGVPILPFSNAAKALNAGALDTEKAGVTVDATPTVTEDKP